MLTEARSSQPAYYTDPSVEEPYSDVERPPDPEYTDPYSYLVPVGRKAIGGGAKHSSVV